MSEPVAKIVDGEEEAVKSEDYNKLVDAGCTARVAECLDAIFQDGEIIHLTLLKQ